MSDSPGYHRTNHKWAMVAHKGGKCLDCGARVTDGNFDRFHFHHITPLNRPSDNTDRWAGGGAVRDWPPFTEKWFAWADRVDLLCEDCHTQRHSPRKQMSLEDFWAVQKRLDDYADGKMNGKG